MNTATSAQGSLQFLELSVLPRFSALVPRCAQLPRSPQNACFREMFVFSLALAPRAEIFQARPMTTNPETAEPRGFLGESVMFPYIQRAGAPIKGRLYF